MASVGSHLHNRQAVVTYPSNLLHPNPLESGFYKELTKSQNRPVLAQGISLLSSTCEHPGMDTQFSSNENRHLKKPNRKRLTQDQLRLLETTFNANRKLQVDCKLELARRLRLPPRQVAIWYQNRRAREKSHTIELEHKTIQLELDNVLAENRRLEQEVCMLKHKLYKAHQMLSVSNPSSTLQPSLSTSDDKDLTSSSSPDNMIFRWEDPGMFPLEEIYSCQIGHECQPEEQSRYDMSVHSVRL